jgi:hypothetical protein
VARFRNIFSPKKVCIFYHSDFTVQRKFKLIIWLRLQHRHTAVGCSKIIQFLDTEYIEYTQQLKDSGPSLDVVDKNFKTINPLTPNDF